MLKVNFKKVGRAAEKIENGEFAMNDASTKHDIDLGTDWDVCFFPGQRVEMSMVFEQQQNTGNQCPAPLRTGKTARENYRKKIEAN